MAKGKRKKTAPKVAMLETTAEQLARSNYKREGMTYRKVPVIDTMLERGQINERIWAALSYYREQASLAERSPTKDSLDREQRGGEFGLPVAVMSAILETAKLERDMGSLYHIARAVAVDDMSLSQWCIKQGGGRERYDGKGKFIAMVPMGGDDAIAEACLHLKFAASRIMGIDPVRVVRERFAA